MSFAATVQEARRVVGSMGTWVVHETARAQDHAEWTGFVRYCSMGLERKQAIAMEELKSMRGRSKDRSAAKAKVTILRTQIGAWRRATRWLLTLAPEQARAIAAAVLRQVDASEPYYRECGHPWLKEGDVAPRVLGRPRMRALATQYRECGSCGGFGWT